MANGLVELKQHGSITIVQDKESSCVFGMPKEAIQLNAARYIYNPKQIRDCLEQILKIIKYLIKKEKIVKSD